METRASLVKQRQATKHNCSVWMEETGHEYWGHESQSPQPLAVLGSLGLVLSHLDQTTESPPYILTYSERLNSDLEHTLLLITPPAQRLILALVGFG